MELAALDGAPEDPARAQEMVLTDDRVERPRPHPVGQGGVRGREGRLRGRGGVEQLHHRPRPGRAVTCDNDDGSTARSDRCATGVTDQRVKVA